MHGSASLSPVCSIFPPILGRRGRMISPIVQPIPQRPLAFLTRPKRGRDLFSFVTRPMNGLPTHLWGYKVSTSTAARPCRSDRMNADGTVAIRGMVVCSFRLSGRMTRQTGMISVLGCVRKPPKVETNQSILDPCITWATIYGRSKICTSGRDEL